MAERVVWKRKDKKKQISRMGFSCINKVLVATEAS